MTPPASLIQRMLTTNGAHVVERTLREQGYDVSLSALKRMRERMIRRGEASAMIQRAETYMRPSTVETDRAVDGSDRLFDAIHALYQRRARELGCSVKAAEYLLNFNRAQLEKMAA